MEREERRGGGGMGQREAGEREAERGGREERERAPNSN